MTPVAVLTAEQLEELMERAVEKALAKGAANGVLSTAEAARIAGRSEKTVRAWVASGALAAQRRGRVWAVRREDLDAYLAGTSEGVDSDRVLRSLGNG